MKKLLLMAILLFIPLSAAGQTGYSGPRLNRSNNFGYPLYDGFYNGTGFQPGLSYYPNSQFYSQDYYGGRRWVHQGNFYRGYGIPQGNVYTQYPRYNNFYGRRSW